MIRVRAALIRTGISAASFFLDSNDSPRRDLRHYKQRRSPGPHPELALLAVIGINLIYSISHLHPGSLTTQASLSTSTPLSLTVFKGNRSRCSRTSGLRSAVNNLSSKELFPVRPASVCLLRDIARNSNQSPAPIPLPLALPESLTLSFSVHFELVLQKTSSLLAGTYNPSSLLSVPARLTRFRQRANFKSHPRQHFGPHGPDRSSAAILDLRVGILVPYVQHFGPTGR